MMNVRYMAIIFGIFLLFGCSKSEVVVKSFTNDLAGKDNNESIVLDSISVVSTTTPVVSYDSFEVSVEIDDDGNNNSSAILYYCNETDSSGCDPMASDSLVLTKVGDSFVGNVSGLVSPYDPGDTINYIVVVTDPDGVTNTPPAQQITLALGPPTKIFRSVGAGNTTALVDHNTGADTISISGDQVSFSTALPDNIGVGDVLVYDTGTKIAFIHERTDSQNYTVKQADGESDPDVQTVNNDWEIYRAYTSMQDAEEFIENAGIPAGVVDFDNSSRDIVTAYQQWNFAFYADGFDQYGGRVEWDSWTTSKINNIKLYTPYLPSEVGISQRHNGVFDETKYYLFINATQNYARGLTIDTQSMIIDGLQIKVYSNGYDFASGIQTLNNGHINEASHIFSNNIIAGFVPYVAATSDQCGGIKVGSNSFLQAEFFIYNNIIYGFQKNYLSASINAGGKSYIYNNTLVNSQSGIYLHSGVGVLKNNLISNVSDSVDGNANIDSANSSNNIFYTADTNYSATDKVITNSKFNHPEIYDYRLAGNSHGAVGGGVDLSSDLLLPITEDITNQTRTRWDIGATTAPTAIFRSVGQGNVSSLKGSSDRELSIAVNSDGHTQLILVNGTTDLPLNIGLGDAIQYDPDNAGGVDTVAFIHERIDQNNFIVKNAAGANTIVTTANSTSWDIFRAYSGIGNAESGIENNGIQASLRDFDTWSNGRDLNTNNEQWNLVLYADLDLLHINVDGWITGSTNYLKIFAPKEIDEVGESQAHDGTWAANKARLTTSTNYYGTIYLYHGADSTVNHVRIENLQIENTDTTPANRGYGIYAGFEGSNEYFFKNNFVKRSVPKIDSEVGIYIDPRSKSKVTVLNNIIDGFMTGLRSFIIPTGENITSVYANNTITNSENGILFYDYGLNNRWIVFNNLIFNSSIGDFAIAGTPDITEYADNMTSDGTSPGGSGERNKTFDFYNPSSADFRLVSSDTGALGIGTNLELHPYINFKKDIKGFDRDTWDVGAHAFVDYSMTLSAWNELGSGTPEDPYIIANKTQLLQIGPLCGGGVSTACSSSFQQTEDINLNGETWTPIGDNADLFTGNYYGGDQRIQNLDLTASGDSVGFFGSTSGADILNLRIDSDITAGGNNLIGILAGLTSGGNITNVSTSGNVSGCNQSCGGLIGRANGSTIEDTSSSASVSGASLVGGLIGTSDNSNITDSYTTGDVTGSNRAVGGLIGSGGYAGGTISNVYSEGTITGLFEVGGLIGYMNRDNFVLTSCHATGNITSTGDDGSGVSSIGGLVGSMSGATGTMTINNCYALGDVYAPGQSVGGLVGHIDNSGSRVVSNSWATGDVKSLDARSGGLIGYSSATVSDSFATGRVEGYGANGGLIGVQDDQPIDRSYALGEVICKNTGTSCYSGGLVGSALTSPVISNSYAKGNVYSYGGDDLGGLVGRHNGGSINDSFYEGNIFGDNIVGGIVGQASATSISRSYAKATVSGGSNVGGIAGRSGGANVDIYFIGSVRGDDAVGGLIGEQTGGSIDDSFVSASVIGSTNTNAVIGLQTSGSSSNLYWNSDETAITDANAITKTTDELTSNDSLAVLGFDDTTAWTRLDSRNFPIHKATPEGRCIDNLSVTAYNALGSGTSSDPYIICNKEQLSDIGSNCDSTLSTSCNSIYNLGSDIEMSSIDFSSYSIGRSVNPFTGVLDGRGHKIKNLSTSGGGLFNYIGGAAQLKNIILKGVYYVNSPSIQGIVTMSASAPSFISHIEVDGYMESGGTSGAILGRSVNDSTGFSKVIISNNNSMVDFYSISSGGTRGGIAGNMQIETYLFKNKYMGTMDFNSSSIGGMIGEGDSYTYKNKTSGSLTTTGGTAGGIIGIVDAGDNDYVPIERNISSMDLNTGGDRNGGILGYSNDAPTLLNNLAIDGILNSSGRSTGGIIGDNYGVYTDNNLAANTVVANGTENGGIFGYISDYFIGQRNPSGNFWDSDISVADPRGNIVGPISAATGLMTSELDDYANYSAALWDIWDLSLGSAALTNQAWVMGNNARRPKLRWSIHPVCQNNIAATSYNSIGSGTADDPYKICFKEQLLDISVSGCDNDSSAGCGSYFMLMNDIDLKGETYAPIGDDTNNFTGGFNGGGHTISNLTISAPAVGYQGMFGVSSGIIENINLVLVNIEGLNYTGALVGVDLGGTISNVYVKGEVIGNDEQVGGVIGQLNGSAKNINANISVTMNVPSDSVGGIAGIIEATGVLENSNVSGSVTNGDGTYDVDGTGGAVGRNDGVVGHTLARVEVIGGYGSGGLIGFSGNNGLTTLSYALGTSVLGYRGVGGFIGHLQNNAAVSFCYSRVSVLEGTFNPAVVGGFVGGSNDTSQIVHSFSTATTLTGAANVGAFTGYDGGLYIGNYWDNTLYADTDSNGEFEGLATGDMDNSANFTGWNNVQIWRFPAGGYPELISEQ